MTAEPMLISANLCNPKDFVFLPGQPLWFITASLPSGIHYFGNRSQNKKTIRITKCHLDTLRWCLAFQVSLVKKKVILRNKMLK